MTEQQLRSFIDLLRRLSPNPLDLCAQRSDDPPLGDILGMAADELEKTLPAADNETLELIRSVYNARCSMMPKCTQLTAKRLSNLRARIKEDKARTPVSWWIGYFVRAQSSDFLSGRKTDFKASFDWLINKSNMVKVLEGNYDNRQAPTRGAREQDSFLDSVTAESDRRGAR